MRRPRRALPCGLAASLCIAGAACASDPGGPEAEPTVASSASAPDEVRATVLVGGRIYTVDAMNPWADALAFDADGVIIAVGSEADARAAGGNDALVIDLGGAMVLPGFQDIHLHVPEAGLNAELCWLSGSDLAELEIAARDCANDSEGEWVLGAGASLFALRDADELPVDVLDRAVPDRPALVLDDLGHAVWTNTLGLEAAGIGADHPDPQGGVLHRDSTTGRLSGLLLEDAQQLVRNAAAPSADTIDDGLADALDTLSRHGITSISDAGGYWAQGHADAWQRAADRNSLTVRAVNTLYLYPDLNVDDQLDEFAARLDLDASDLLTVDTAKVYVDGILDLGTALLLEPYEEAPDARYPSGFGYFEPAQLTAYVDELHQLGYRINFHAVGDGAVRAALDAVEGIDDDLEAIAGRRHRTTHGFMVDSADVSRYVQLGVVADIQLNPDAIDTGYHEDLAFIIGNRAFDLIPTGLLLDAGATVTLSSDWDAGPLSPLATIARGLARDEDPIPDLETALALYTIEAAYALGHDSTTGSLEVGKFADLAVLEDDLFDLRPLEIADVDVLATYVGGRLVYAAPNY